MRLGTAEVIRADSRNLPLADNSVDLVVTSPPYFALRSYQDGGEHYDGQIGAEPTPDEFVTSLLEVTAECVRVLKPSGSLWVNLGDKYAGSVIGGQTTLGLGKQRAGIDALNRIGADANTRTTSDFGGIRAKSLIGIPWRYALRCIDDLGLILRAEVIWSKPNGLPESVTDRVRRSHEQWFHFTLQPRYFSAVDEIREATKPHPWGDTRRALVRPAEDASSTLVNDDRDNMRLGNNPLGKLPGSVWTVPTEPLRVPDHLGVDHFAAFPTEWPKRIIQGWSPSGVCVECGEGRRPVVAKAGERPVGRARRHLPGYSDPAGEGVRDMTYTVTGYACACNEPIATPTGGRAGDDPTRETGRAGFNRPRGDAEGTRVVTRWEQRHEAEQLRTSPHRADMEAEAGMTSFEHYIRSDRSGARPIPEDLRQSWRDRGWLTPAPEYVPAPTTPAVVLDPFGGTGTTAMVAKALGRHGISVDMSADYCRLAEWRTNDRDQLAKVLGLAKAEQQPDDQLSIFDIDGGAA